MANEYDVGTIIRFKEDTRNPNFRGVLAKIVRVYTYDYFVEFLTHKDITTMHRFVDKNSKNIEVPVGYQSPLWKVLNGEEI